MSDQPTNPNSGDEAIDDLEVPANEADAVTGGIAYNASEDSDDPDMRARRIDT